MTEALHYSPEYRNTFQGKTVLNAGQRFNRVSYSLPDHKAEILADDFGNDTVCEFVRLHAGDEKLFQFILPDEYDSFTNQETGWLFRSRYPDKPHYWLPVQPVLRNYDRSGRIVSEKVLPVNEANSPDNGTRAVFSIPEERGFVEFVVWALPADSGHFEELYSLSSIERQKKFVWGSYIPYSGSSDLYHYIIYGSIYKSNVPWTALPWRRTYCEVVAHALYIIFHSLWKATGKQIYRHMKTQLVFSASARLGSDGAWHHGSWTDDLEVHFRHHCGGIHMLAADHEETEDAFVESVLQKAISYLNGQYDELSCGRWFLHDSLEKSDASIKKSPLPFLKSRALGKSISNMLVLNTHLDALVALSRYEEVTGRLDQKEGLSSGKNAAVTVLGLRPAEFLYRILFSAIELTYTPISRVRSLPLHTRVVRKLAKLLLIHLAPRVKNLFPRLVMPNGYIDRDLSVNYLNHEYLAINIWDLLRFQRRFRINTIDAVIGRAIGFALRSGLVESWSNNKNYALGFWAETAYLECLSRPEGSREILADAVIALSDSGRGLPPSLLGCNPEFIPLKDQVPCISQGNDSIVIVNLSTGPDHPEFLLVNCAGSAQETELPDADKWVMRNRRNEIISPAGKLMVPARDWMSLKWV